MLYPPQGTGLDLNTCRIRTQRLRDRMQAQGMQTALLMNRRHVYYFTGYWHFSANTAVAAVIPLAGPVTLIAPGVVESAAVEQSLAYEAGKLCTLVDDQAGVLLSIALPLLHGTIGTDELCRPWLVPGTVNLNPTLYAIRRTKDPDEVAMLGRAIACCDAAYAKAKELLQPGVSEMHLYAQLLAAASEEAGEPIGDFGNDFQSGTPGGLPGSAR